MLRSGGVLAFPTDTVYGLGASADDELAQKRIYQVKGRPVGLYPVSTRPDVAIS